MIWWKEAILLLIGLCAGGAVAAGIFAFIAMIGVVPRLAGRSHTAKYIERYEDMIVEGGTAGNLLSLYGQRTIWALGEWIGAFVVAMFGLLAGVFVGCLVMSLTETLDAMPILARRVRLKMGLAWVILAFSMGKMVGSLVYFWYGIGA